MLEGLKKFIIGDDSNFSEQKHSIEDAAAHVERFYNKFKEIVGRNSDYIPESVVDIMRLAQQQNIRIDELEATNSLLIERLDKLEAKGTLEQDKVSHENNLTEVEKLQMLLKG
jgi:hypothetical protein